MLDLQELLDTRGACRGEGTDRFYADDGADPATVAVLEAAAIAECADCPVRAVCLAMALDRADDDDHGVWGATTAEQRRDMRRTMRRIPVSPRSRRTRRGHLEVAA